MIFFIIYYFIGGSLVKIKSYNISPGINSHRIVIKGAKLESCPNIYYLESTLQMAGTNTWCRDDTQSSTLMVLAFETWVRTTGAEGSVIVYAASMSPVT